MMIRPVIHIFFSTLFTGIIFSQWVQVSQVGAIGEYATISVADCNTIVIAGGTSSSAIVYRSTNGGLNFSNITTPEIMWQLFCCWAVNKDTIFVGDGGSANGTGGNARVYKTFNGGVNWTTALTTGGNSGFISGIVFERPNLNFGIAVSDPPISNDSFWIAKTTNKGGTWTITRAPNTAPYSTQYSPFVVDNQYYGFGLINGSLGQGRVYLTSNGGSNWIVRSIGLSAFSVPSIAFQTNKMNGIAVSDIALPNLAATSNSGVNWQTYSVGSGTNGVGIVRWVPGTNIYYLSANRIKRTSTGGVTWEDMNTSGVLNFSHMDLVSAGVNNICAYALASDGKVLKYQGEPFAIEPISNEIPNSFVLYQNYPNPFNPVTKIRFDVPVGTRHGVFTRIDIYNVLGHKVSTLVYEELIPGTYEVEFEGSDLSSGVYYYKFTSGEYAETKKMILLK
jgi:hypothetical protein